MKKLHNITTIFLIYLFTFSQSLVPALSESGGLAADQTAPLIGKGSIIIRGDPDQDLSNLNRNTSISQLATKDTGVSLSLDDNLKNLYYKHIEYYDELIPHVFLGDLTRYIVDLYKSIFQDLPDKRKNKWNEIYKILSYLENGLSLGNKEIQELIAVSFIENLDLTDSSIKKLEDKFGPYLKKELQLIRIS